MRQSGMKKSICFLLGALLFTNTMVLTAAYSDGANDKEIKIGNTSYYTGPIASYGTGTKIQAAYFNMINDKGGVRGRKIVFISRDDAYNPANTVKQTRRLVERDKVRFIFNSLGTVTNLSVRGYLNRKKVPQLYVGSGNSSFNNPKKYPWTVPGFANYFYEGQAHADYILKNFPKAKIGVLYQNDDYGKDLLSGLEKGLGDKAAKMIVRRESYEVTSPTVDLQVIQLKYSGADVFVIFAVSRQAIQALRKAKDIQWQPIRLLNVVSSSREHVLKALGFDKAKGVVSFYLFKDISNPKYANDPDVIKYKAFMKKYAPLNNPLKFANIYGYAMAHLLIEVLKNAGDDLSRANILKQATNIEMHLPLMNKGVNFKYTSKDYTGVDQFTPAVFDGEFWQVKTE